MAYTLDDKLVIGIASRALFDLDEANRVFEQDGLAAYRAYQREHENEPLKKGTAFPLVNALLKVNQAAPERLVEVVLVSRNDADSGLRILHSCQHHGLDVSRAAFTGGRDPYRYLGAFSCDLFLSANEDDVRGAIAAGFAAGLIYPPAEWIEDETSEVRIAFDGDAVLFADASERVFQQQGLQAFQQRERELAEVPLDPGPFKPFLVTLSKIQNRFPERKCPIRTALVTARNSPAHERVINTLRYWEVRLDESLFLGGVEKARVLSVFKPHIFFDDQIVHCEPAASIVPTALVPPRVADVVLAESEGREPAIAQPS